MPVASQARARSCYEQKLAAYKRPTLDLSRDIGVLPYFMYHSHKWLIYTIVVPNRHCMHARRFRQKTCILPALLLRKAYNERVNYFAVANQQVIAKAKNTKH